MTVTDTNEWLHIFSFHLKPGDGSSKSFIGAKTPRFCRFCRRTNNETSFRDEAHIIPEAFGNRSLFSLEECDDCNQNGSLLENDLVSFLSVPRAMSRIPGKKGMPKLRLPPSPSYIQSNRQSNEVRFFVPDGDEGITITDNNEGTLNAVVKIPRYSPLNVAKALFRMAFFGLHQTHSEFEFIRSWLGGDTTLFPIPLFLVTIPGGGYNQVRLMVHKFILGQYCVMRVGFLYSNFLTVAAIPLNSNGLPDNLPLIKYPPSLELPLLANTSAFLITDDSIEKEGLAEVTIFYETQTVSEGNCATTPS